MLGTYTCEKSLHAITADDYIVVWGIERSREGNHTRAGSLQMVYDDFASQRRDGLTLILHTINGITNHRTRIVNIQQTFIVGVRSMARHRDIEVTKRLERHSAVLSCT